MLGRPLPRCAGVSCSWDGVYPEPPNTAGGRASAPSDVATGAVHPPRIKRRVVPHRCRSTRPPSRLCLLRQPAYPKNTASREAAKYAAKTTPTTASTKRTPRASIGGFGRVASTLAAGLHAGALATSSNAASLVACLATRCNSVRNARRPQPSPAAGCTASKAGANLETRNMTITFIARWASCATRVLTRSSQ
jgi:hypothetical protein